MNYNEIYGILLQIRQETAHGGNTRQRVYEALKAILDYVRATAETSSVETLLQQLNALRTEINAHYEAGVAHEARFQEIKNIVDEKISEIELGGGSVDVTNLLRLYDKSSGLLINGTTAHVTDIGGGLLVAGESGSEFLFLGVPTTLEPGKYTLSFAKSDPTATAVLSLIKLDGDRIDFQIKESGDHSKSVHTITLSETVSILEISYRVVERHANVMLSSISLVRGDYVGYALPPADFGAGLASRVSLDLSNATKASLASIDISESQEFYFYDGEPRKATLKELLGAISIGGRVRREVAEVKDLKNRIYSTQRRMYRGTVVVYLNGQALFEECGDFTTLDEYAIRITKENINDPHDTDKVVVEAIFIN